MIRFRQKGNFAKLSSYFDKLRNGIDMQMLEQYASEGVAALSSATPVDTGRTAASWYSKIATGKNSVAISFFNSNIQNGVPIAIVIQYGHATPSGYWVEGRDYINPAIQPVFDKIAEKVWKGVTA